jgi:tetratricopeptide (TPR) repeat protein
VTVDGASADVDPRLISSELRSRLGNIQPDRIQVARLSAQADLRLDATLRGIPSGVRVDALLTDLSTGRRVWSETFHRSGDAADFPLEVAMRVTRAVVERYVPEPRRDIVVRKHVPPRALALYNEARAIRARPAPQRDVDRAIELLEAALQVEPEFGEAWSAIGDIWTERAAQWMGDSRRTALTQARIALGRANTFAPECPEALTNRAMLAMQFDRGYAEAERSLRAALAADDAYNEARVNLAMLLSAIGQHDRAIQEMRRASVMDPARYGSSPNSAFLYLMARRYGDASAEYHAVLLDGHRPEPAQWGLMCAAIGARRWDDAARALSALLGESVVIPSDVPDREPVFRKELRRFEPILVAMERDKSVDPYVLACFYAQTGETDRAIAALDRAVDTQSYNAMFAFVDPRLDGIRGDRRFVQQLDRLGLRW